MDAVERLIDQVYDGATDPAAWPQAMAGLCALSGAHHTVALVRDGAGRTPFVTAFGVAPDHLSGFVAAMDGGPMDWLQAYAEGEAFDCTRILPLAALVRTDFYCDVIRPMGGYRAILTAPIRRHGLESVLSVCRGPAAVEFGAAELALVARLAPHVRRALTVRLDSDARLRRLRAALAALDQVAAGLAIVDPELRPVLLNRRAETIIARGDGLVRSRDGLTAVNDSDTRWLRRLVRRAAADDARAPGTYVLRVHRPLGPAFEVSARRLDARHSAGAPLVALLIEDPVPAPGARAAALVAHYGLTPREALLAATLAEGRDLADTATMMNIAPGTARNYLKAVFRKTGTHRQAALVRLVLRATRFDG